jgi:chromosomal replication initiation ATPase DnaA
MDKLNQLALFGSNFVGDDFYSRDKYVVSQSNNQIVSFLSNLHLWSENKFLILIGSKFSGKSHLINFFSEYNSGLVMNHFSYDDVLSSDSGFNKVNCIGIDDIEDFDEIVLFHILNYLKLKKKNVLMTTKKDLNLFSMNDLRSRLLSYFSLEINEPDEVLFEGIFMKILSDYDIKLNKKIINYILFNSKFTFNSINYLIESIRDITFNKKEKILLSNIKKIVGDANLLDNKYYSSFKTS